MIKKILKFLLLFFSVLGSNGQRKRYYSNSYLKGNDIYIYQNYCNLEKDNCFRIYKIDKNEVYSDIRKEYYNIDSIDTIEEIKKDFEDIELNRLLN